jgi:hypothetical protein
LEFYAAELGTVEIAEPHIDSENSLIAYTHISDAIADYVHKKFRDVKVGIAAGEDFLAVYEQLVKTKSPIDFIAWHCRDMQPEAMFAVLDKVESNEKVAGKIPILISECDYPSTGTEKFDYLMRRTFAALKRDDLMGLLHYRLDQAEEGNYLAGLLWAGVGAGKDKIGLPMHDVYDAYLIFNSTRCGAADCRFQADNRKLEPLLQHLYAVASGCGDPPTVNLVLYYDSYHLSKRTRFERVDVNVHLSLTSSPEARRMRITQSRGVGFTIHPSLQIAPGESSKDFVVSLQPHTAVSIVIQPELRQSLPHSSYRR